jgi:hypothetical protein
MEKSVQLLDDVALAQDMPQAGLVRGQVGTVVEQLAQRVFAVEFCDNDGKTYALATVGEESLIVLHYAPVPA